MEDGLNEKIEKELLNSQEVPFEEMTGEEGSPLNEPVEENEIGFTSKKDKPQVKLQTQAPEEKRASPPQNKSLPKERPAEPEEIEEDPEEEEQDYKRDPMKDAPEQEIKGEGKQSFGAEEEFELPDEHAAMAAESFIGMADNIIDTGCGFLISIKKHKDFYDFDELIQIIDTQNEKNIQRVKLDEQDKILLRPLLIAVIKRKAKKLTPEQQLLGVALSIVIKKSRVVMQIRAENEILVERILDIIRESRVTVVNDSSERNKHGGGAETKPVAAASAEATGKDKGVPNAVVEVAG